MGLLILGVGVALAGDPAVIVERSLEVAAVEEIRAADGSAWWRVDARPDDGLRVRCDGAVRRAVAVSVAGGLVLVEGEERPRVRAGRSEFGPPVARGAWQAVRCEAGAPRVQAVVAAVPMAVIDAAERRARSWSGLAMALSPWVDAPEEGSAWAAVRPGGGALVAEGALRWDGAVAVDHVDPGDPGGARGAVAAGGAPLRATVQGPARVRVEARAARAGDAVCASVAGQGACRRAPAGDVVSGRVWFEAWVPKGQHEVEIHGAVWSAGRLWDGSWLRHPGARPERAILAPADEADAVAGWWTEGQVRPVLVPARGGGWVVADGAAPWQDGAAEVWWGGGQCAVDVGGQRWIGRVAPGPQAVVGAEEVEVRPGGCPAWVRGGGDDAWASLRLRDVAAGEPVRLAVAADTTPSDLRELRLVVPVGRAVRVQVGDAAWTVHPVQASRLVGAEGVVARLPAVGDAVVASTDGPAAWILAPAHPGGQAPGGPATGTGVLGPSTWTIGAAVGVVSGGADLGPAAAAAAAPAPEPWRELPSLAWSAWPEELAWVPEERADEAVLEAARAGDALTVARALGEGREALRWWREAAAAQVLTGRDALRAWVASVSAGVDAQTGAAAIAAWSREVVAEGWTGGETVRVPWVSPPLLAWDPGEGAPLRVGAGWVVRADGPVRARCASPDGGDCVLRAVDAAGRAAGRWAVPCAAEPVAVDVAAGLFLEGPADDAIVLEVAGTSPRTTLLREVRRVEGHAALEVRGPTVVRVSLDRPTAVRSDCPTREVGPTEVQVIAPDGRACRVEVVGPVRLRATVRAPRAGGEAPNGLLAAAAAPAWPAMPEATPWSTAPGQVDPRVVVRAGVQAVARVAGPDEQPGASRWTVRPTVRIDGHRGAWFGSVGGGAWVGADGATAGGVEVGGEWRSPVDARWRGWLSADADLRAEEAAGAVRGVVVGGVSWRGRAVELRATAGVDAAAGWGALEEVTQAAVWSRWRGQHAVVGTGSLRLRVQPTRWLRVGAVGELRTNAPGDPVPLDAAAGGVELWAATPRLRAELRAGVQHRTADDFRAEAWTSPELAGELDAAVWAAGRSRLVLSGRASWLPAVQLVGMEAGLSVWWSGRRGLVDARPSRVDGRAVIGW